MLVPIKGWKRPQKISPGLDRTVSLLLRWCQDNNLRSGRDKDVLSTLHLLQILALKYF